MERYISSYEAVLRILGYTYTYIIIYYKIYNNKLIGYMNPTFSIYEGKTKYVISRDLVSSNNNKIN